jgi:uncharacterized protein YggU (UPF0235/DUF167 family)
MLFDPLEEQFDMPTRLVELSDGERRQQKIICEKDKRSVSVGCSASVENGLMKG